MSSKESLHFETLKGEVTAPDKESCPFTLPTLATPSPILSTTQFTFVDPFKMIGDMNRNSEAVLKPSLLSSPPPSLISSLMSTHTLTPSLMAPSHLPSFSTSFSTVKEVLLTENVKPLVNVPSNQGPCPPLGLEDSIPKVTELAQSYLSMRLVKP